MLLIFADDWGRHPSSCQHLIRCLLPRHRVAWVNTIGTRPPRFDVATLRRGFEKLRHWSQKASAATQESLNPRVLSPRMWPWFTRRHDRWLNARLLSKALRPVVEQAEEPVYAVTTIPIVADLMSQLPVERWTYYCVDDFSEWPGLDRLAMEAMEHKVIEQADEIISVSANLSNRLLQHGRRSRFLPHGVDLDHWDHPITADVPNEIQRLARPLIVFWGVIDRRMDVEWVHYLARSMPTATILLVGPLDNPHDDLFSLPNIQHHPPLPYEQLPALGQMADVLIMPYADLPVTRAMQPLKLKEYLATGKPVVVRNLPAVHAWEDCLDIATSAEAFSALVQMRLTDKIPPSQTIARRRLQEESWAAKAQQFEAWVCGHAASPCPQLSSDREQVSTVSA